MSPTPGAPHRHKLFISYARDDKDWLERFKPYLTPAAKSGALETWWDDEGIPSGTDWAETIESELASATAALVLVSAHLLTSDFIRETELPAIHARRRSGQLRLYWVPISDVGGTNLRLLGLHDVQAAAPCNPEKPLEDMTPDVYRQTIRQVCDRMLVDLKIVEWLGWAGHLSEGARNEIVTRALDRLAKKLELTRGETIAYGDFTIVCRGRMQDREVAVKVLAESLFRQRNPEFQERVKKARDLEDPTFLKLRHCELQEEPQVLVVDYLDAPTLAQYLTTHGSMHPGTVARLILRLVLALHEYHRRGLLYGTLSSRNIFYDESASLLRLQPVGISSHLSQSDEPESRFPRDSTEASYLTPEQYEGSAYTAQSDQYGVGLIALEMLIGQVPVTITRLADLGKKLEFFDDPGRFAGRWQRDHSRLRNVIFRMLQRDPAQRFANLGDAYSALARLEPADVSLAKKSYSRACAGNRDFYAAFYRRFFARCPEAESMFGNLEEQYVKLDSALHYLLNFADQDMTEPTALTWIARRHERLQVTEAQFTHFAEALLETLREFHEEDEAIEAWERTVRPGVRYLSRRRSSLGR